MLVSVHCAYCEAIPKKPTAFINKVLYFCAYHLLQDMYNYIHNNDTIVALATANGTGAIAVIRLSGERALEICQSVWKGKNLLRQPSHTAHLGYILDKKQHPIDQVLATIFKAPNSYTRENTVEISCHGSPYIAQRLIELLIEAGARPARAGEFTLRAFLNGQLDLAQAEAVADLIAAESEASHRMAIQQMRGGFSKDIAHLREELIQFASLIELELDFGEEDVEFADRQDLQILVSKILAVVQSLQQSFQYGNVVKNGVSTVIAGRPNAGKSTLLNALLNEERAIVSDIAGTTRDTIEENLIIHGVTFRLIDTAGIREASDQIEAIGVQKTIEKISQAAILVYMYDAVTMTQADVEADLSKLRHDGLSVLVVANKVDVIYALSDRLLFERLQEIPKSHIQISAKQKQDLDALREALYARVVDTPVQADATIVTNARHYEALHRAGESLQRVLDGLRAGVTGDFIAMDIRHALRYLGEITGQVDVDDLLDNIFSKFCIGK